MKDSEGKTHSMIIFEVEQITKDVKFVDVANIVKYFSGLT